MELRSDIERTDCAMKIPFVRDFQIKNKVNAIEELDNQSTVACRLCIKYTVTESASECMCVDGGGGGEGVRPAAGPVTIYAKTTLFFRFLHSKYSFQAENQRRKMQTFKKTYDVQK
jgi:hypothetical protein